MGARREGREAAVQFLYHRDLNGGSNATSVEDFWDLRPAPTKARDFAMSIVTGAIQHQQAIDEAIRNASANYDLHRIAAVDRNIIRVAVYEMLFCPEIPPVVSINEAIEIAKRFGSEDSGRFVNGILDRIRSTIPRAPRTAKAETPES